MQIKDSTYISYGGKPVKQAWYEGTLVWQASSFGWTFSTLPRATWTDIEYSDNGTLFAVGNNRYSYSIDNGINWSPVVNPINPDVGTETYNAIACGPNNRWIIFESRFYSPYGSGKFYTTVNPATGLTAYTFSYPLSTIQFVDAIYSSYHGKYIAIGNKDTRYTNNIVGAYSNDGINWLSANYINTSNNPLSDNFGFDGGIIEGTNMVNKRLVASGSSGNHKFGYSDNGITWKQGNYTVSNTPLGQNLQTGCNWSDVVYGQSVNLPLSGRYVAANLNGSTSNFPFAYSDDGINWYGVQSVSTDINKNWKSIVFGNGYFVACSSGFQGMSKDGINWLVYSNLPSNAPFYDICVANNRFVSLVYNAPAGEYGSAYANFIF